MRSILRTFPLAGAVAVLLAAGCTNSTGTCDAPDVMCGDTCSNLKLDPLHCGNCEVACNDGFACVEGACKRCSGDDCFVGDVFAACFQAGTVVPIKGESGTVTGPSAKGIEGPQSFARLDDAHLVAVGSLDSTLFVIDRQTMQSVELTLVEAGSASPNQVVVRDGFAYVVNSQVNTVQRVDLTDPARPRKAGEVSTGTGTNPFGAAFDAQGRLWVSLLNTDQVLPITFDGMKGTKGTPVDVSLPAGQGKPFPAGVASVGDAVYVTLNNLDTSTYKPAGNGFLAVIRDGKAGEPIDLGSCTNPGFISVHEATLWIACTGPYDGDAGEVVGVDTETGTVATRVTTGGRPGRVSADPDGKHVWAASGLLDVLKIDVSTAPEKVERIPTCAATMNEFTADVLAF